MRQFWRMRRHCEVLRPPQLILVHCVAQTGRQFGPRIALPPGTMILFGTT
jgi:hypothetical protein